MSGAKMPGTGDAGTALQLYPADDRLQHSEILGMRDTLDGLRPRWLAALFKNKNYAKKIRTIPPEAVTHASVARRFALDGVQQADGFKRYQPDALRPVRAFAHFYGVAGSPPASPDAVQI